MTITSSSFNSAAFERLGISVRNAPTPQKTTDYFRARQEADADAGKAAPLAKPAEADRAMQSTQPVTSVNAAFLAQLLVQENSAPQQS